MLKKICQMIPVIAIAVYFFCGVCLHAFAQENSGTLTDSADSYIDAVEKASGGDVIYNLYYDFDGNGTNEMFALVRKDPSKTPAEEQFDAMEGRLWYVNTDGAIEVMSQSRPYHKDPKVLEFDGNSILPLNQVFATGTRTYLWGVIGGKPYELNASGQINGLSVNKYGEIEGIGEDYNSGRSKDSNTYSGHTWNKYYFYYEHGNIREYGGKNITWEDFCRIPGIEAVKNKIEEEKIAQGEEIDSIYYRSNGIVAVNFEAEDTYFIKYSNMQLRITEDGVEIGKTMGDSGFSDGRIAPAFLDELATYPETFPY